MRVEVGWVLALCFIKKTMTSVEGEERGYHSLSCPILSPFSPVLQLYHPTLLFSSLPFPFPNSYFLTFRCEIKRQQSNSGSIMLLMYGGEVRLKQFSIFVDNKCILSNNFSNSMFYEYDFNFNLLRSKKSISGIFNAKFITINQINYILNN